MRPDAEAWLHPLGYDPSLLGQLVASGWQTLMVDRERYTLPDDTVRLAYRAIREAGGRAVSRPEDGTLGAAQAMVALGADRIIIPMVESAGQMRALRDGLGEGVELIPLVETRTGLLDTATIAGLDFVETIMFGPHDLAVSLGLPGWPFDVLPGLLPILDPAFRATAAAGKRVGFHVLTDWGNAAPFDRIDVLSCALDDVARPRLSTFPGRFFTQPA